MNNDKTPNPFYDNPLFTERDLNRIRFSKWNWIWLWIFPTFVQLSDGYVFFWKRTPRKVWLIKVERLRVRTEKEYDEGEEAYKEHQLP